MERALFPRKQSWTVPEFMQMMREREALMKADSIGVEVITGRIMKNPRIKRMFIMAMAGLMHAEKVLAKSKDPMATLDEAGFRILTIVRGIGYWICIILCLYEILKCLGSGDTKDIGRIIFKYLLVFAALFFVPLAFDFIRDLFQ